MHSFAPNANDLGYDGSSAATRAHLKATPATDAVWWLAARLTGWSGKADDGD